MKKQTLPLIIFFGFFLNLHLLFGQTPGWNWAKCGVGESQDYGYATATDVFGNVYVTGEFYSSPFFIGAIGMTNAGYSDIFIAKYDSLGTVQWAKCVGGSSYEYGYGITTDNLGNVYITGAFESPSITFGSTTLTNANKSGGTDDLFIAKYNSSGNLIWARSTGNSGSEFGTSITADIQGNTYIAGYFNSPVITFSDIILTNADNTGSTNDIFIVKYNSSGNVVWADKAGGLDDDYGNSVATDMSGNIFITGYFTSTSIRFGIATLSNTGYDDVFLTKYNSTGTVQWAKSAIGDYVDKNTSVATDTSGNAYISGVFKSSMISFGGYLLANTGSSHGNIFLTKYNSAGSVQWTKSVGDVGEAQNNYVSAIAADKSGDVYVTGWFFNPSVTIGNTTITNTDNTGQYNDVFITKYNSLGNSVWAKKIGEETYDYITGITVDTSGHVFVTGYYDSALLFFGTAILTNSGYQDFYLARLDNDLTKGLNETLAEEETTIAVFPNPVLNDVTLKYPVGITHIQIFTIQGRLIKSHKAKDEKSCFNVSELPAGVYILQLSSNKKSEYVKMIKG